MAHETEGLGTSVLTLRTDSAQLMSGIDEADKRQEKLKKSFESTGKSARAAGDDMGGYGKRVTDGTSATEGLRGGLTKLGGALLAAFSVAAVTSAIRSYTEFTGKINDMSAKTGIGTEALQRLKYAAEQNGASLEQVTGAVTKLGNNLAGGNKNAVGALDALGLSLNNIRAMEPDKAFTTIADAIAKVPDPMDRSKLAMDLFGKSGAELLPMMRGNLSETAAAADRLGIVMSDQAVKAGDQFGDTLSSLTSVGQAVIAQVLTPMIPALTMVALWLGENIPRAISGVRGAFDWLIKKGMELKLAFEESILGIVELGAKVPWLGEKLGATSTRIQEMRASVQLSKDTIAAFDRQTQTTATTVTAAGVTLGRLKLNYDETGKAAGKAAAEQEKFEKTVSASLERVRYQHFRLGESALVASQNVQLFGIRMSEVLTISNDYSMKLTAAQIKTDAFGHALQVNVQPSLKGVGGELTQTQLQLEATGEEFSRTGEAARNAMDNLAANLSANLVGMLTGTQKFSDGWRNIWAGIKGTAMGFLTDILNGFVKDFIGGMLNKLTGSQGGFTQAFGGMTSGTQGVMKSLTGTVTSTITAWVGIATAAFQGIKALWDSGFGRGGEEGVKVNPAREDFFNEYGGSVESLGSRLAEKGIDGESARKMIERVFKSTTMKEFGEATEAIHRILKGFRGGTHGEYVDFGAGTPVMLHGRERIMTEAEGRSGGGNVIKIFMDGLMVARAAVPHIPGEVAVLVGA